MHLWFVRVQPSAELRRVLLSQGVRVETLDKLPTKFSKGAKPSLVAFFPKSLAELKSLKALRAACPHTWITVIAKEKWLTDSKQLENLLELEEKNEVWIEDRWESTFWFSLQAALKNRKTSKELKSLHEQYHKLSQQSERLVSQLERDVSLAGNIQRLLLPKFSPDIPGVSVAVKYLPASGIGGDYYDIFEFGDKRRFGVILADAKSHGVAASLLSVLIKVRLEELKDRFPDSRSFVDFLNNEILSMHDKEMASLSLLYGILDRSTLTFQYTVAGPMRPILWRMGEAPQLAVAGNPTIGGASHYAFRENFLRLQPGDLLILHTDGLDEPLKGKAPEAIAELLSSRTETPEVRELQNEILALIDRHVERQKLKDDITVIHLGIDDRVVYLAPVVPIK